MSNLELEVWQRVAGLALSPSHDFHHIERVQAYADRLGSALGVDTELVRLAAILHDLGRGDELRRHGIASIEASKEMAESILRHLDLSDEARRTIIEAIDTHDQPDRKPEAQAGRILKDADFLAGFGAWGVLRIAMWSGETGRTVDDAIHKITSGMQRRLNSLEFDTSRDAALREALFARLFQAELDLPARIPPHSRRGFYFILEGISGVGKNTVASEVCAKLAASDIPYCLVEEPGDLYRQLRDSLSENINCDENLPLRKALLIADRAEQFHRSVLPALDRGEVVVSVRSYLSTAVYQASELSDAFRTLMEHEWVGLADLLILLDADVPSVVTRIGERNRARSTFETPEQLLEHRTRYQELAPHFPSRHTKIIDASADKRAVIDSVFATLSEHLEMKLR